MRTPRLSCGRACLVLLLAVTLGGSSLRAGPPAAEHPWSDAKRLVALFHEALGLVEKECGAPFKTRPVLHIATRADIREVVREDIEPLAKALELDSDGLDKLAEILGEAAMGLYQDDQHVIHIVPENMIEVPTLVSAGAAYTEAELRLLLVHEGTHAWDWERFPIESLHHAATTGDELRTLAAVTEGHAQLVAERVATQLGATEAFARLTGWITSPPAEVPESTRLAVDAVVAYAGFAYVEGHNFMRAVFEARGHEGVAAVLTSPPKDPDVIEHPKRWLEPGSAAGPDLAAVIAVLKVLVPEPRWETTSQHVPAALLRSQAPRIPESHRATFLDGYASAQLLVGGIASEHAQLIAMALTFSTPAQADHFIEAERLASALTPDRLPPGSTIEKDSTTLGAGTGGKLPGFVLERVLKVGTENATLQMHAARFENVVVELNLVNTPWLDRPTLDAVLARVALTLSDPAAAAAAPALVIPTVVRTTRSLVIKVTGPDGSPVPRALVQVALDEPPPVKGVVVEGTCELVLPRDVEGYVCVYAAQDAAGRPLPYAPNMNLETPRDATPLHVQLEGGEEIRGRVETEDPALLAGVDVIATATLFGEALILSRAPVGPDGAFHLVGLWPNAFTLSLVRGTERASLDEVELIGVEDGVVLRLRAPSSVVVTVLGPDGHPVPGASVEVAQHPHDDRVGLFLKVAAQTDGRGEARLEGLDPKLTGVLRVDPPTIKAFLVSHRRSDWMPKTETITLARGFLAKGRVTDAAGAPVFGAEIRSEDEDGGGRLLAISDVDGGFRTSLLPPTGARLYAALQGVLAPEDASRSPAVFVSAEKPEVTLRMPARAAPPRVQLPVGGR